MIRMRHVLCPVDLSESSQAVFGYATMLAQWYGASLTALEMIWVGAPSVRPTTSPLVLTSDQVKEFSTELQHFVDTHTPPRLHVASVLQEGPVVEGILQQAHTLPADLIVMGTHGRGGFERFILGSTAEKVLRKAPCPVLTVPPASVAASSATQPFTAILCPVDFSPPSLRALSFALSLAHESGKRLIVLHVIDWPVDRFVRAALSADAAEGIHARHQSEAQALGDLHAAIPDDARTWCECQEITAIGRPYEEILRVAEAKHADLIVMGVHGRNSVELALFGSTTNHVVRRAACPVLTIRP